MRVPQLVPGLSAILLCGLANGTQSTATVETKRNNLVAELLNETSISEPSAEFTFTRATEGWVFIAARFKGVGTVTGTLDPASRHDAVFVHDTKDGRRAEAVRYVAKGEHRLRVECTGRCRVDQL